MKKLLIAGLLWACIMFSSARADSPYAEQQMRRSGAYHQAATVVADTTIFGQKAKPAVVLMADVPQPAKAGINAPTVYRQVASTPQKVLKGTSVVKPGLATHFGWHDIAYVRIHQKIKHNGKIKIVTVTVKVLQDSGRSTNLTNPESPFYGINTDRRNAVGAAVPLNVLLRTFRLPPVPMHATIAYWKLWDVVRRSALEIRNSKGVIVIVPIADIGPGPRALALGHNIDLCQGTSDELGGDGPVTYRFLFGWWDTHKRPSMPTAWPWAGKSSKSLVALNARH